MKQPVLRITFWSLRVLLDPLHTLRECQRALRGCGRPVDRAPAGHRHRRHGIQFDDTTDTISAYDPATGEVTATRMVLLAPFKKLEDDTSYQLYSAPVGGGEATQLTKVTDTTGSKHVILAWTE